jgi:hypothetical protein
MDIIFIISPKYECARLYLDRIRFPRSRASIMLDEFDIDKVRGLVDIEITILNAHHCNRKLMNFVLSVVPIKNFKLEYKNV